MNILKVTATYPPNTNGVAISTERTVRMLRRKGHGVIVIGPNTDQKKSEDYIALYSINKIPYLLNDYPIIFPYLTKEDMKKLFKTKWDIIHVHHPFYIGMFAVSLGKKIDCPVVFTYHTQYDKYLAILASFLSPAIRKFIYDQGVIKVCNEFDGIIATTQWLQKDLKRLLGKTTDVYYASTAGFLRSYYVKKSKLALRKKLGLPKRGPIFISVSRLSKAKNMSFLIRAFARWFKKYKKGNLVIVGDGTEKRKLETLAKMLGLKNQIVFSGKIPNNKLSGWYTAADVFLYSSITDTIGINIIEAMSARLPVVAIDHFTTREVIEDKVDGILTKKTYDSFVLGMRSALKSRHRLRKNAVLTARKFSLSGTTDRLLDVYKEVVKSFGFHP